MTSVAIVHDVLAARGGAERVALALAAAFPDAPIHTLVHEPAATFDDFDPDRIRTTSLNRFGVLRRNYRATVPAGALTFAASRVEADVVICSTAGMAHHVRCAGSKLVYCYTPARWLHNPASYLQGFGPAIRVAAAIMRPGLGALDRAAMRRSDRVLTISPHIRHEIRAVYGLDADVVAPCSTLDLDGPVRAIAGITPGFVLSPTRSLGYKRLDVLVSAARALPDRRFVHVGDGPWQPELERLAPANLVSLGVVDDSQLRWLYRNASVVALTCAEDFGLVPLEADAHGVASVAPGARGFADHPAQRLTTYELGSVDGLVASIRDAPPPSGVRSATPLGVDRFVERIRTEVERLG